MTTIAPTHGVVVVRADDAERHTLPGGEMRLLADGPATAGQLSIHRTILRDGADGAHPHHHTMAAELFYVLTGSLQVLIGDDVVLVGAGDVAVVPPGTAHAFAAAPGCDAELLAVVTPGAPRFDFFRRLARVATGQEPPGPFMDDQASYDVHADDSPAWRDARAVAPAADGRSRPT
jgi:mannose-6-phosphate isomerase-like protein (cupin superfamily)